MLALTMKPGDRVQIGEDVYVHLVWISGDRVRLGVEAPRDVLIAGPHILRRREEGCRAEAETPS